MVKAKPYQDKLTKLLKAYFKNEFVYDEWDITKNAKDGVKDSLVYAPRLDIAVGPFNITTDNKDEDAYNIRVKANNDELVKAIIKECKKQHGGRFWGNENPRCMIAIEIELSGSSKHILGDYANASMMGYVGVVISSSKNYKKISRVGEYLKDMQMLEKASEGVFSNTVLYTEDEFLALVEKHLK